MANNFESSIEKQVADAFMIGFESERVLSKNVNTQFLTNAPFDAKTGDRMYVERPTDYRVSRSPDGDVSAETPSDIIAGQAFAEVQDMFTVFANVNTVDQAIRAGNLEQKMRPMAKRLTSEMETDFGLFALKKLGLMSGTYGTPVTKWDHVAEAGAMLESTGVPMNKDWCMFVNPFTQRKLASDQRSLGAGGRMGDGIATANEKATIAENFAGMTVKTSNHLASFTSGSGADRVGALSADPNVTYLGAKNTMTQTLTVSGFQANLAIKAGEVIQITGRNRLSLSTRTPIVDENGDRILFTGTVTTDVTLSGTGTGTIIVTGPALFETLGQYNTVESAPVSGDIVTLLGSADTLVQPNLFWHKDALCIGSIPLEKMNATDQRLQSKDGLQIMVTKDSDFLKRKNLIRIDLHVAFGVLDPFYGGQGFGRV